MEIVPQRIFSPKRWLQLWNIFTHGKRNTNWFVHTGDSRWLELRSLVVKLRSHFFSLYNKANLLPIYQTTDLSKFSISQTKPWAPLHKFHCFSLSISRSLDCLYTLAIIKRVINTHWAYRYLDNGGRRGQTWTC